MLVTSKQLGIGRSHSWDTLGGNEVQWAGGENIYDHQGRITGRRKSLSHGGDGGGYYESPAGVRPPDLDLKRDPCSYQDSLYSQQCYTADPRGMRKGSVSELNHYDRPAMAHGHRESIPSQGYYSQNPGLAPRQPEDPWGYNRNEQQPHLINRSLTHCGISPQGRPQWDQGQGGRPGPQGPALASPLPPPPPPPTAHNMNQVYGQPTAVPTSAKIMQDGQRPAAHYSLEQPPSPRYASEPPPLANQALYTDVNGRPMDPRQQQPAPTCLVVDPNDPNSPQRGVMRQDCNSLYGVQHQQQQAIPQVYNPNPPLAGPAPCPPVPLLPAPVALPPPPLTAPQTSAAPVDSKRNADPEFLALLRNEGLSESTISSLIQQGFDSTGMLAVMEENDIRSVAPNLGQARVLSRVATSVKRPLEPPPTPQQQGPSRGRSNSFSHRSDMYLQQQQQQQQQQALGIDPRLMPAHPGAMQTISPAMAEAMARRPNSAPSQHLLETTQGYPGSRSPGPYGGGMIPLQSRPMSAYSQHQGVSMHPGMQMMSSMPQHQQTPMPGLGPPQQAPKAYSTNYGVPMELMKRDRSLQPLSPMPSPQMMRKGGGGPSDGAMGTTMQSQSAAAASQKQSRRTGPPVIVSTMASPDTSKFHPVSPLPPPHPVYGMYLVFGVFVH
ncbi:hypothetical protein DPEC_G00035290 [Dallia pectoralis]|uniref:Uncharacterized protein n=1 Tax=Dallia pectoralis TaxID=75939 RepID=A0ACC2HDY3_DALPE|nr:hypothetical protein DPEC_G00035290 [Dallia pectoralis]